MSFGRYLIGVAALLCVLASLGVGAAALRRYLLPNWGGAHARLAEIVTGCALLVGIMEILGTVGLFRLVPIVLGSIAVGLALRLGLTSRSSAPAVRPRFARPRVTAAEAVLNLVSVAAVVVVLIQWTRRSVLSFERGITGADSIAYHLPHAAFYAQTGQIRAIPYTDFEYLTGLFPATSELFHALGIVLMGNDVLSPGINLIWLVLTLFTAWCIGSVRGLGFSSMLATALVMATPMLVASNAGTADNDLPGVFFVTAAVALWMHTADLPDTGMRAYRSGSIIAAVAGGLALSVKLNLVGPVAALTLVAIALAPRRWRRQATGWWVGGLLIAGGYWYARNLVQVGNPLPWFSLGVLPTPHPPPLQHANDYSLADYAGSLRILRHWLVPALNLNLGPWWPALVVVAVVGPAVCLFSRRDRVVMAVALIALASLVAYTLTPLTACGPLGHPYCMKLNMRYGASALTLALAVTPLALLFRGRLGRLAVGAGLTTLFVATIARHHPRTDHSLVVAGAAVVLAVADGRDRCPQTVVADLAPTAVPPRHRRDARAIARADRGRIGLPGYPVLPEAPLHRQTRAVRHLQGVALGSKPAPRPNRCCGNPGRVLRLSPLGSRRHQSRHIHRPARSQRLVPAHHQLSRMAHHAQSRPLPVRGHHRQPNLLHHRTRQNPASQLDTERYRSQAGALPEPSNPSLPADRATPPRSLLENARISVCLAWRQGGVRYRRVATNAGWLAGGQAQPTAAQMRPSCPAREACGTVR